ncbi:hypothetical protein F5882DRAFT_114074 [Hyaloscypha sp. PMI_1271]|nr:hypothetical protein F5882DRAFT_114074 [Hyaloscypha sp. PMI_1271]
MMSRYPRNSQARNQLKTSYRASATDKTGFWPSQSMIQASSWEFWQQEPHPTGCPPLVVSPNTAAKPMTSIATQTSEDPMIGNTPHQVYMPTTRTASRTSRPNVNRRASANFTCHIDGCTRSYARKFELARHLKTHSGIKEHHCRFATCIWAAPNGFARKDHLKQHLRQVHKTLA